MPILRILLSLCLAVLAVFLLSSASTAKAQSVSGGATIQGSPSEIPGTIDVSARIGSAGPQGTLRIGAGEGETLCKVVDLCVVDNQAFVVAEVKYSSAGIPVGWFILCSFQDNGQTDDTFSFVFPSLLPFPVSACALAAGTLNSIPISQGNFVVSP